MNSVLITRETDYALRILRALADGGRMTTEEICREEQLPRQFAYKILKKLEQAGLVGISRGAEGGCRLRADLKRVSLYDLTSVMGGDRAVSACMQAGYRCARRESSGTGCQVHLQLLEVQRALDRELRSRSLYRMLYGPGGESAGKAPHTGEPPPPAGRFSIDVPDSRKND